jgi:hypothetical protein
MAYLSTITIDPTTQSVTFRDHGLVVTVTNHALQHAALQFGHSVTPFDISVDTIRDPARRVTQEAIHAAWMAKAAKVLAPLTSDASLAATS